MIDTYILTLKKRIQYTKDIYQLTFELQAPQKLTFEAGQYMIFRIPQVGSDDPARRLYSISSPAGIVGEFDIIMQYFKGGVASEYFTTMKEGATVAAQGPAGVFIHKKSTRDQIFIATGTGITPIMSMLRTELAKDQIRKSTLLWGIRTTDDMYFLEALNEIRQENPNFTFRICMSQAAPSTEAYILSGRVQSGIESIFEPSELSRHEFYVCGSIRAVEDIRAHLYLAGVPREQVHFERFV